MQLVIPATQHLDSYIAALRQGWSSDTERGADAALEELQRIESDPAAFLAGMEDRDGNGPPVTLPDGSQVKRLPSIQRWMWDGEFCGRISLRWQPGTTQLPPSCLGHIGYAVVPWKQRQGFATAALRALLPEAWAIGLPFVEIVTDPENLGSQKVIKANGGIFIDEFTEPAEFGSKPGQRYRIDSPGRNA